MAPNRHRTRVPVPGAVIFDLDGTLVDSYGAITECFNHAREALGEPALEAAAVRRMVGHGLESLMSQGVGPARMPAAVRLFRQRYARICTERTTVLPGVADTLARLHRQGLPMAVATNKPERFARRILDALSLSAYLELVAGPDGEHPPKPHPAMLHRVLRAMGVPAQAALYVGDMELDVETARRAGVRVWLVATGGHTRDELDGAGAEMVFDNFSELPQHLLRAGNAP